MLSKRIIPCMDIKDGRVVKGTNFKNLKDAGDPVELAKSYSIMGADELVFLDITAGIEKRKTLVDLVRKVGKCINIPFTVGGGVQSLDDVKTLLDAGADKVSIGSAAIRDPKLVRQISNKCGAQVIVISVDAKKNGKTWNIFINGGRDDTGRDAISFSQEIEMMGAGELLVNSLDRDGQKSGYDIPLLKNISEAVRIPVIASSGAGCQEDFLEAFRTGKCDAALAASLFHFGQLKIPDLKKFLFSKNIPIRL
jgi:cyclase